MIYTCFYLGSQNYTQTIFYLFFTKCQHLQLNYSDPKNVFEHFVALDTKKSKWHLHKKKMQGLLVLTALIVICLKFTQAS